ncbi:uncharacterized protein LOC123318610 [Coccinella septempunctata]|uniref:uncharacterized protein LOC123318610 n=1 Tax=Coccinella septempunctata TaxID=41139 RepID=UPI001D07FD5E|nr:uncharacterized protein LOC123318610 [Coccinella septempunctata]
MAIRISVLLLLAFLLTIITAFETEGGGGAMYHKVLKSGEKVRFITPNKDANYVTCAEPAFQCCQGAQGLMSEIISAKCLRGDGLPGICCNSNGITTAEVMFSNGSMVKVILNEPPNVEKAKFDSIADEIERNREKNVGNK